MNRKGLRMVKGWVKWFLPFYLFTFLPFTASAQRLLTLDSCRAMALRNNKQMNVAKVKQDVAENLRKSARTKYLPHVSAIGTYQYTSREISLLNDQQKQEFKEYLEQNGCDFGQGFWFSRPLPLEQLTAFLEKKKEN